MHTSIGEDLAGASPGGDYQLLDCGGQARLERFGPVILQRPSPASLWRRRFPQRWKEVHAVYHRSPEGGGDWERRSPFAEPWWIELAGIKLRLQTTGFGHLGLFPEQAPFWEWIRRRCARSPRPLKVLNLFAYTGGSSIAAAQGAAEVTHCDASRGIVQWASENARANGFGAEDESSGGRIRWIVDDAAAFAAREIKRGHRYDAVILDPPSFGRGPKGQVWKLEADLPVFLTRVGELLTDEPAFVLLSAHTPGVGPLALRNLLADALAPPSSGRSTPGDKRPRIDFGEMSIADTDGGRRLPSGTWAVWSTGGDGPKGEDPT